MSEREIKPPISPADSAPKIQAPDSVQEERIKEIREAKQRLPEGRQKAERLWKVERGYSKAEARTDYLVAIQDFIMELEPVYQSLEIEKEYWEPDAGKPLVKLERPGVELRDLMDPKFVYPGGYPRIENEDALDPEVVKEIACLPDALELESAKVPFSITLQPVKRSADPIHIRQNLVLSLPTLDSIRRAAVDWAEAAGLGVREQGDGNRGRIGEKSYYVKD